MLSEYDIVYMTKKAIKKSEIVDHLANNTIEDYEALNFNFLDEDVMAFENEEGNDWWIMYFNGVVNICGHKVGVDIIPKMIILIT